jgi:hypothetical protein
MTTKRAATVAITPVANDASTTDLLAKIREYELENAILKAQAEAKGKSGGRSFRLKASAKGGLSAYGLGRFPVTLYVEQWEYLLDHGDEVRAFIADPANAASLKRKEDENWQPTPAQLQAQIDAAKKAATFANQAPAPVVPRQPTLAELQAELAALKAK